MPLTRFLMEGEVTFCLLCAVAFGVVTASLCLLEYQTMMKKEGSMNQISIAGWGHVPDLGLPALSSGLFEYVICISNSSLVFYFSQLRNPFYISSPVSVFRGSSPVSFESSFVPLQPRWIYSFIELLWCFP